MQEGKTLLTRSGYDKLQSELEDLKVNKRKEIADKIKEARAQGDLSENAEYDAAKDEQRDMELRIEEIENILKHSEVVADAADGSRINIGSRVTLLDIEEEDEFVVDVVGSSEANSLKGRISNESPVGRAIMGREVGDIVTVETQAGDIEYKVLKIEKSAA